MRAPENERQEKTEGRKINGRMWWGNREMSLRDRESKLTINTNINHILLFFFYSLSFTRRYLLSKSDILWRRWSPPKLCCPDISRVIDHAGNTVTLTKACRSKYITLKQEVIHHCGHEGGFYSRSEYYYVHILLCHQPECWQLWKTLFFFSTCSTPQHRYNPFGCLLWDFWDNWSSFQSIVCLSSSRGWVFVSDSITALSVSFYECLSCSKSGSHSSVTSTNFNQRYKNHACLCQTEKYCHHCSFALMSS